MTTSTPDSVRLADTQLYRVTDAMRLLRMSRTVIYDQIRTGRLRSVKQGRARLITPSAIRAYIALLEKEAEEAA
ncbi:helix-turn-helix domain-containing protein [Nonomuraea sp. NN258]|uniref:helix-turn-helix domain-containing protein n=1 Tax=Nonomuraea antri TaxID=2730852 RepID=UPI0015691085|nr:helix-turn-helix domain-containing protein [Nonomuraea antri]NRQ34311.1 helix-turn-helix domain-containing protein [Nonomuraea antri]